MNVHLANYILKTKNIFIQTNFITFIQNKNKVQFVRFINVLMHFKLVKILGLILEKFIMLLLIKLKISWNKSKWSGEFSAFDYTVYFFTGFYNFVRHKKMCFNSWWVKMYIIFLLIIVIIIINIIII